MTDYILLAKLRKLSFITFGAKCYFAYGLLLHLRPLQINSTNVITFGRNCNKRDFNGGEQPINARDHRIAGFIIFVLRIGFWGKSESEVLI